MSNLAEKLPASLKNKLQTVEAQGKRIAERLDRWVESTLPSEVSAPLRGEDGVSLTALRSAAVAARSELVKTVRTQWVLLTGGAAVPSKQPETPASENDNDRKDTKTKPAQTTVKKTAARKPATRKPPAKKAGTKGPASDESSAQKPVKRTRKSAAKKSITKRTAAKVDQASKKKTNNQPS